MVPPIDIPVIERHLEDIRRSLSILARFQKLSFEKFEEDPATQWAVEKGLERCVQNVLDIGAHILASLGVPIPEEYHGIIITLGEQGVIPQEFAKRIAPMAGFRDILGFRNILVHEYLEVDLREVYNILQNGLDDFERFAAYVIAFIKRNIQPSV